jgi:hypothetical protein
MHLVLEQSPTPIYQRLIAGICRALVAAGHRWILCWVLCWFSSWVP